MSYPTGCGVISKRVSDVVIEKKFIRVRPQADFIEFARALEAEVGFYDVICEHVSLEKEFMVGF